METHTDRKHAGPCLEAWGGEETSHEEPAGLLIPRHTVAAPVSRRARAHTTQSHVHKNRPAKTGLLLYRE